MSVSTGGPVSTGRPTPRAGAARLGRGRRAALALLVASRVWSTATLSPTLLTAAVAAPATALALEPSPASSSASMPAEPQSGGTPAPAEGQTAEAQPGTAPPGAAQPGNVGETPAEPGSDRGAPVVVGRRKQRVTAVLWARHHPRHRHNRHSGQRPRRRHRRHHRRAPRAHTGLRLSAAAARRAGGTPWIAPPKPAALGPAAAPGAGPVVLSETGLAPAAGGMLQDSTPVVLPVGLSAQPSEPPRFLIPIYRQAGRRYHVPWRVLAAINSIETDYGRDLSVSSQGAVGWMQFMPDTWRVYGQGGNPYDPRAAIFAAARLLHAAGASHDLRRAIFAYNHAAWYVAAVLWRAGTIDARAHAADVKGGYALPLDARYMHTLGRTDDGVDIETAPDGAAVYSIAPGAVVAVASDPGGFGPNYPVVLATAGPLAGHYIYYGHVAASLVRPGQQVGAGQPIAVVGHTGDAAPLGHGHIEIGFCDAGGDPLSHHGAQAWTPSGQTMRLVLQALAIRSGIAPGA